MTPTFCGIDFGTSNSTLALADHTGARLVALEDGAPTLPTAVFLSEDDPRPRFGRAAIAAYVEGEEGRLMRGLKSTLGSPLIHERTRVGARAVSFRDVVLRFFGELRARLDAAAPGIDRAVLGRPVHFVDDDPAADAQAVQVLEAVARDHGFREVAFQFEPVAAALAHEATLTAEEVALILDVGGGTSDVSILRLGPDRARRPDRAADILANEGIRLGGTDFDRALSLAEAMPHLGYLSPTRGGAGTMPRHYFLDLATWHRINALYTDRVKADLKALLREADRPELLARMARVIETRAGHALAIEVERVKVALSADAAARLMLGAIAGGPNPVVGRAAFEAAAGPAMARMQGLVLQALSAAALPPSGLDRVFLTGGAAHMPQVAQMVERLLPGVPVARGDMLGSVGLGLALEARRRFG